MALYGQLLKNTIKFRETIDSVRFPRKPYKIQERQLVRLLKKAKFTAFGMNYRFENIIMDKKPVDAFQRAVPVYDYDKMYEKWWYRLRHEEPDVCWPGKIKYFALSSGTSGAPSKHIPVSAQQVRAIRLGGVRQMTALKHY